MSDFSVFYSYTDPASGDRKKTDYTITASSSFQAIERFKAIFEGPGITPYKVLPA